MKNCGPQHGVPGNLICEDGKWQLNPPEGLSEIPPPETPPAIDGNFVGWGGACKINKASVCSVVMDGNKKVSAKFKKSELPPVILPPGTLPISIPPIQINQAQQLPLGINNPFSYLDTDIGSENCIKSKSALKKTSSYSENHIKINDIKECLPVATSYMNNIKDIGVNVISQHFTRRYDGNGMPYFGSKERENETAIQLYVSEFGNYFWAAVNPASSKGFIGDIDIETHKILIENKNGKKDIYLPASEAGFAEWQKWLNASFDYLKDHNALDKLVYFQIGNESDGDYAKASKIERDDRSDFYWSAYAKLIEKSYDIIRSKSSKTKIAIGAMGAGGVTVDGFQRPVLEYLAGKIDDNGLSASGISEIKRCGGSGCFDVYDYHNFSGYKEYKGRTACQPRDCVKPIITIKKTPEYMNKLLSDSGFHDKKLVVQQGGTYTGQDSKVDQMEGYQTEEDQASYLVKRGVYLLANGAEQIQFGTYIEKNCHDSTIHNWFTMMGFVYNGTPKGTGDDCAQIDTKNKKTKQKSEKTLTAIKDCDGQLPCPDPGAGVKKLSYYASKKTVEVLKGSDWNNIQTIQENNDVYVYKFIKNGKNIWVAWNDNSAEKQITISGIGSLLVKITEAVPRYESGKDVTDYSIAFNTTETKTGPGGTVTIILSGKPVFVEEK